MKIPFNHQDQANAKLWDCVLTKKGKFLVIAPVASGKSFMISRFAKEAIEKYPTTKVLILCHVSELLLQIYQELIEMWPEADVSFYCDKLGHKNLNGQIILASIQSVGKKGLEIPGGIDLVICDEAHLISPKEETLYRKLFKDIETINRNFQLVGFTGTGFRSSSGLLTEGDGRLFTEVAYQIPMLELINKGILCPLITPQEPPKIKMSVEGVKTRNGDYIESQLQKAVDKDDITKACVTELIQYGQDRKKWIVFTSGVEHCRHVTDEIKSRGISCEMITGTTPSLERNSIFQRYKSGEIKCLVNVGVATTGTNIPDIDMLVLMRPTKSPVLYVQIMGRACRVAPNKLNALIIDFTSTISELGPVDTIDARILSKSKNPGDAPVKICPKCHAVCFAGSRECQDCGFPFPFDDIIKLQSKASDAAILSSQQKPLWHKVIATQYSRHKGKNGKADTFRAKYTTYTGDYNEFLGFESLGGVRQHACTWHRKRLPNLTNPYTIDQALKMPYPQADEILVQLQGKYGTVIDIKFKEDGLAEILPPLPTENNILAEMEDIPFD